MTATESHGFNIVGSDPKTYDPMRDYWRLLRLQIKAYHQFRPGQIDALDTAIELAHPDRKEDYAKAVANYRTMIEPYEIAWLDAPRRGIYTVHDQQIRVNPEMHLQIDNKPYVVKIAFGKTIYTARQAIAVMESTHGHLGFPLVFMPDTNEIVGQIPEPVTEPCCGGCGRECTCCAGLCETCHACAETYWTERNGG